jgi:DNA-binding NtrC family response regulator
MLTRMLEARGYRVSAFTSGPEAMAAFRRSPEAFDAVISDQTMPRLGGVELAREVHARRADLPVILTTGYRDRVRSEEFKREIAGVATKPFDAATLIRTLRAALDRH